ncbi:MAG: MlaD family protein [Bacteroides sp.]
MKKYLTKEVKIGIASIVAISVLIYGINYLKGIHMFQPSNYFYAHFQNVNGLTKSSPVFADGVRVGIVRNIGYDYTSPGNITVEVELDTELRIPKGSSAELISELMGGVRMNILLANNPREKYNVGDTIPGVFNNGMMESASELMPQIKEMLPKMDSILTSLNTILKSQSIPSSLQSIETTTANLAVTSHQLKNLMSKDIPQLTSKLNKIGDNFIEISNDLNKINYSATFNKIDSTINNVKIITDKLQRKDNTVGLLLNSPDLYNNLNTTATHASALLEDLKSNPKRYVHFSLFGKKDK